MPTGHLTLDLALVSLGGPCPRRLDLTPPGPLTVGRRATHHLHLADDDRVSRDHAVLTFRPPSRLQSAEDHGQWLIADSGSTRGTWVNGVRLPSAREFPIRPGDLIVIEPWTFRVSHAGGHAPFRHPDAPPTRQLSAFDSGAHGLIARVDLDAGALLAQQRLALLLDCAGAIHAAADEPSLAHALLQAAIRGTGYVNAAYLRPIGEDGEAEIIASRGGVEDSPGGPTFSRSLVQEALSGKPACIQRDRHAGGTSILRLGIDEALCVPVNLGGAVAALLYLDSRASDGAGASAAPDAAPFAVGLAQIGAMALANVLRFDAERRHAAERQALFMGAVEAMVASIDAKDTYTRGHSERVSLLAAALARTIDLDAESVERVRICGLVHDVGKIGVPEALLRKPADLTPEEYAVIKAHPIAGHRILSGIPQLAPVLPGVLHHHERWDGDGYPGRLRGTDIPLFARIIALADTFDAMSSARAYRAALHRAEVVAEIMANAGTQLDPDLAPPFVAMDFTEFDEINARADADPEQA